MVWNSTEDPFRERPIALGGTGRRGLRPRLGIRELGGSYDAALAIANDSPLGLAAGIMTQSLARATHFRANMRAGTLMVNLPTAGTDYHVPFGGTRSSSYGPREQGRYAAEFYTTVKTAYTLA